MGLMPFETPLEATVGKHKVRLVNSEDNKQEKILVIDVTANGPNIYKFKWDE
jgi:hypothetical protein